MIRLPVQSQWLQKSCGFLNVSASCRLWSAGPMMCVHYAHSRLGPPWIAVKSPPTCSGNWCQGQMELSKRSSSAANLSHGTHFLTCQLTPYVHSINYQVVNFVSDAHNYPDPNAKKTFRGKKTKVGQMLQANPVVRVGQRKIRQRDTQRSVSANQIKSFQEECEFDHDEINIHSTEGALLDSLPTDLNEILSATHAEMDSHRIETSSPQQSSDNDSNLNEFDKQYFSDAAHMKCQSAFSLQSQTGTADVKSNLEVDVEGNEFDQQYFGNLQDDNFNSQDVMERRKNFPKQSSHKNPEPVYMDTSTPEDHLDNLAYGARTQEALKDFDKQLGRLFEDAGQDKSISIQSLFGFEPHEKATEFQKLEDEMDHKELTFTNEIQLGKKRAEKIPTRPLKAKLEAERIVAERKKELRIGDHNLSDLEPEIIKAMKAVWQAKTRHQNKVKTKIQEGRKVFGSPDLSLPATDVSCSGCGARFQGKDPKLQGFLPSEKYRDLLDYGGLERAVCQRCWYLTHHHMALDVSIGENDYKDIITTIRRKNALVVVLVDLLDFPCSLIPNLKMMVGETKPMVIVGNKADLLPWDSSDCNKRIAKQLLEACVDAGVCNEDIVKHVGIISAKSGFGIEDLITALQKKWGTTDDVYLLGTANVGKSTLFNRLLQSDYCKAKAAWMISKATISRWPGTTLNLLRFPIVKPTAEKMALRADRLSAERKQEKAEEEIKKSQRKENEMLIQEAYVTGSVGRSYDIAINADDEDEKELDDSKDPFSLTVGKVTPATQSQLKMKRSRKENLPFTFRPEEFDRGKWFYDTPGMIHDQQILTKLTVDELNLVIPKKAFLPKTVVLKPGNTIFIAGIGRLDYLEGHKSAFFTIFASKVLPVRVIPTAEADDHYQAMANSNSLKVPLGCPERMQTFPPLQPVEMNVTGVGWKCSAADVLFSSAGWAAVTAAMGVELRLRAYTPGGYGCLLRRPALLPYVVNLRGHRMAKKSPFFKLDRQKLTRYI